MAGLLLLGHTAATGLLAGTTAAPAADKKPLSAGLLNDALRLQNRRLMPGTSAASSVSAMS
ncbi:hypothetical protein [Verrucomicrobium spinosum]|uniref:hypothetical protein n=1 Tax=Verrucomicrobium spinosum TaxID=2736 RepID=UPI001C45E4C5|nr:hypothetical protein [Verrucomicrobium spinosum]